MIEMEELKAEEARERAKTKAEVTTSGGEQAHASEGYEGVTAEAGFAAQPASQSAAQAEPARVEAHRRGRANRTLLVALVAADGDLLLRA